MNKYNTALVPTMGALHEGHLELGKIARQHAKNVIYSIFVNPTQFGENEDFETYPRNLESDKQKLAGIADEIFIPTIEEIYPNGVKPHLKAGSAAQGLESNSRPHFFDGVVSVVDRLFELTKPDIAIFGEKDYQQLMVIEESFPNIKIIGAPIIREPDGLAMSSRNAYLSKSERATAPKLYEIISTTSDKQLATSKLEAAGFRVDYLETRWDRILAAVWLGSTRLIDNVGINN